LFELHRATIAKCLVLAGNDEVHPYPIAEETAKLLPNAEFIPEWKVGAALEAAKKRVGEFLAAHAGGRLEPRQKAEGGRRKADGERRKGNPRSAGDSSPDGGLRQGSRKILSTYCRPPCAPPGVRSP
jgi:hypothetical protein